jgi:hypothetical protein
MIRNKNTPIGLCVIVAISCCSLEATAELLGARVVNMAFSTDSGFPAADSFAVTFGVADETGFGFISPLEAIVPLSQMGTPTRFSFTSDAGAGFDSLASFLTDGSSNDLRLEADRYGGAGISESTFTRFYSNPGVDFQGSVIDQIDLSVFFQETVSPEKTTAVFQWTLEVFGERPAGTDPVSGSLLFPNRPPR